MKNKIKEDIEQKTRKLKKQLNKEPSNLTKVKDNKRNKTKTTIATKQQQ